MQLQTPQQGFVEGGVGKNGEDVLEQDAGRGEVGELAKGGTEPYFKTGEFGGAGGMGGGLSGGLGGISCAGGGGWGGCHYEEEEKKKIRRRRRRGRKYVDWTGQVVWPDSDGRMLQLQMVGGIDLIDRGVISCMVTVLPSLTSNRLRICHAIRFISVSSTGGLQDSWHALIHGCVSVHTIYCQLYSSTGNTPTFYKYYLLPRYP